MRGGPPGHRGTEKPSHMNLLNPGHDIGVDLTGFKLKSSTAHAWWTTWLTWDRKAIPHELFKATANRLIYWFLHWHSYRGFNSTVVVSLPVTPVTRVRFSVEPIIFFFLKLPPFSLFYSTLDLIKPKWMWFFLSERPNSFFSHARRHIGFLRSFQFVNYDYDYNPFGDRFIFRSYASFMVIVPFVFFI